MTQVLAGGPPQASWLLGLNRQGTMRVIFIPPQLCNLLLLLRSLLPRSHSCSKSRSLLPLQNSTLNNHNDNDMCVPPLPVQQNLKSRLHETIAVCCQPRPTYHNNDKTYYVPHDIRYSATASYYRYQTTPTTAAAIADAASALCAATAMNMVNSCTVSIHQDRFKPQARNYKQFRTQKYL